MTKFETKAEMKLAGQDREARITEREDQIEGVAAFLEYDSDTHLNEKDDQIETDPDFEINV
jgi:hypothetical protein